MKRYFAILLVLALVLSFSAFACADEAAPFSAEEVAAMINDGTLSLDLISMSDLYSKTTAVTVNGEPASPALVNYSYVTQYYTFANNYGSLASYLGLNTAAGVFGLSGQSCGLTQDDSTWQDYFLNSAVDSLATNAALIKYAEENGIELTEEEIADVDASFDVLPETAASAGFDSVEDFLESFYGTGCTLDLLRETTLEYSLATKAYKAISDGIVISDDDVREQNPVVSVRHILVKAEADENGEYTDKAKDAAKKKAEKILNQWLDGEQTEDRFAEMANGYSEDAGSNTNGGLYDSVTKGQMVEEFDAFCFDPSRQSGDTGIVYGESASYAGYHVMYFVGENLEAGRTTLKNKTMSDTVNEMTDAVEVTYGPFFTLCGQF